MTMKAYSTPKTIVWSSVGFECRMPYTQMARGAPYREDGIFSMSLDVDRRTIMFADESSYDGIYIERSIPRGLFVGEPGADNDWSFITARRVPQRRRTTTIKFFDLMYMPSRGVWVVLTQERDSSIISYGGYTDDTRWVHFPTPS